MSLALQQGSEDKSQREFALLVNRNSIIHHRQTTLTSENRNIEVEIKPSFYLAIFAINQLNPLFYLYFV